MTLQYINVSAWGGAGKSVLVSLLDGHPDIAINPMHDKTPFALKDNYLTACILGDFRPVVRDLIADGYINFQLMSVDKKVDVHLSSLDEDVLEVSTNFDYYSFEDRWIKSLLASDSWDRKSITDLVYDSFVKEQYPEVEKKYLTVMGVPDEDETTRFSEVFEGAFILAIKRPIEGILATKLNRNLRYSESKDLSMIRHYIFLILESYRIARFDLCMERLRDLFPDRVYLVDFDEMVTATELTMTNILKFLDLSPSNNCYIPTFFGQVLKNDRVSYIGKGNDSGYEKNETLDSALFSLVYRCTSTMLRFFRF